jgi:ABC-type multidrug transport system permease subunit
MFVVLFAYVFGGAIDVEGGTYREFLMGGIFAQTLTFGLFGVAMALAYDRTNGAIDRFHSLPIPRSTFLAGHAVASLIRAVLPITFMTATGLVVGWRIHSGIGHILVGYGLMFAFSFAVIWIGVLMASLLKALLPIALMSLTGLVVGWRIRGGLLDALAAYGLMIAFSFAVIWIGVLLAALVGTPEGVQGVAFVAIFPLTFVASTFVPVTTLPAGVRQFAEWNPVTALAGALRDLFANPGGVAPPGAAWPLQHPVLYTLLWGAAIVAFCAPVAARRYQASIAG